MRVDRLDHLVLTVVDIDAAIRFYTEVLDVEEVTFGPGRKALGFGCCTINLHQVGGSSSRRPGGRRAAAPTFA